MVREKDESTVKSLTKTIAVLAGALATGALAGGAITRSTAPPLGDLKVTMSEPIKVELPPSQEALLVANAQVSTQVAGMREDFNRFFEQYMVNQIETRERYEQMAQVQVLMLQRLGITEREVQSHGGKLDDIEKRLRGVEYRTVPISTP